MTDIPAIAFFTSAIDNAQAKAGFNDMLSHLRESVGGSAEQAIATITTGTITPAIDKSLAIQVDDVASANLDNVALTNVRAGAVMLLRSTDAARVITLRHAQGGSGQLLLRDGVDYALDDPAKRIMFHLVGTDWLEMWRSHSQVFESALIAFPIAASTEDTQAHGLGGDPDGFHWFIECQTAEAGYSIGDRILYPFDAEPSGVLAVFYDAINVVVKCGSTGPTAAPGNLPHKSTLVNTGITDANWKLGYRCWRT